MVVCAALLKDAHRRGDVINLVTWAYFILLLEWEGNKILEQWRRTIEKDSCLGSTYRHVSLVRGDCLSGFLLVGRVHGGLLVISAHWRALIVYLVAQVVRFISLAVLFLLQMTELPHPLPLSDFAIYICSLNITLKVLLLSRSPVHVLLFLLADAAI